jgi:hypothetical protein
MIYDKKLGFNLGSRGGSPFDPVKNVTAGLKIAEREVPWF